MKIAVALLALVTALSLMITLRIWASTQNQPLNVVNARQVSQPQVNSYTYRVKQAQALRAVGALKKPVLIVPQGWTVKKYKLQGEGK